MSLAESLERAAVEMPEDADAIRPANGDPSRLLEVLEPEAPNSYVSFGIIKTNNNEVLPIYRIKKF